MHLHRPVGITSLSSDIKPLPHSDPDSSALASNALAGGDISAPVRGNSAMKGHAVLGRGDNISPHPEWACKLISLVA